MDTRLKLISPSVFLNRLLHLGGQVEMVKSTLAASVMFVFPQFCVLFCFQIERCFNLCTHYFNLLPDYDFFF